MQSNTTHHSMHAASIAVLLSLNKFSFNSTKVTEHLKAIRSLLWRISDLTPFQSEMKQWWHSIWKWKKMNNLKCFKKIMRFQKLCGFDQFQRKYCKKSTSVLHIAGIDHCVVLHFTSWML